MLSSILYLCDPTPEGLFTVMHHAWHSDDAVMGIVSSQPAQIDLFTRVVPITSDARAAQEVMTLLQKKLGMGSVRNMALCWLSELPGCGRNILDYAELGLRYGRRLDGMEANPVVRALHAKVSRVTFEVHRLSGLLRFRSAQNGYCATVEPDHNILSLLAPVFVPRMGECRWCIHDTRRGIWAVYDKELFYTDTAPEFALARVDPIEKLWKEYYDTIAIEGRFNPDCQKRLMPRRYWKNLVEDPQGAAAKYLRDYHAAT
ncbi:MAG: TIGR03915 family putative DNA repair protein [Eubacteriales bacterium]|nr:TIGR03915 family putative DNA repair protein [Eubacteriales bacterium]